MKSKLLIARAHRNLRHVTNFREVITNPPDFSDWAMQHPLDYGETLIGVYENVPGSAQAGILITTRGLTVLQGRKENFIAYHLIKQVELPKDVAEENLDHILVHLAGSRPIAVPIQGGQGKRKDAPAFAHFLTQIIEDVTQPDEKQS
jgi:hypothetical protein